MNDTKKKPIDLSEIRREIDRIDTDLVSLFAARMRASADVAEYKRASGMAVTDPVREAALLDRVAAMSPAETADYTRTLYTNILSLSRAYQHARLGNESPLSKMIARATAQTPKTFPTTAKVACQGTDGAYSCKAAEQLFERPDIHHYAQFADVFTAIEREECRYGVLPIENSTAGSVTEIYDLMSKHRFYIVRALRLDIDHCLLAKRGTKMENITEIVSHKQALLQCAAFLAKHPHIKITAMDNTAVAARYVAENHEGVAAIAGRECATLYDLDLLAEEICDSTHNRTRFICISKTPEIYEEADKTSLILTIPHKPGALSRLLTRFDALRINLTKLESRPIPDRDFEFRFYFDLVAPANSPALSHLLAELCGEHEEFRYLGTYAEIQ
ncbi:MAG: bifunctional chorismate mutase/prephenate dehydratase [Ruminococcaceae bacterium]|nr:bifunctional chorismate mutase/prephenate dehydratase [Oscillospiraceae bacterium]